MENEFKRLQETIDKALSAAESLKKGTLGTDFSSFENSL
jgi:hypothetical protein